jgi:hypothetical protein
MTPILLQARSTDLTAACGLCGELTTSPAGNQLVVAGADAPVCLDCGRKHAPTLAALVTLADAAERISRMGRYSVFPPLTALLDLASAAEQYTSSVQPPTVTT